MVGAADEQVAVGVVEKRIGVCRRAGKPAVDVDFQFRLGEDHGHVVPFLLADGGGGIQAGLGAVGQDGPDVAVVPDGKIIGFVVVERGVPLVDQEGEIIGEFVDAQPGRHGEFGGFERHAAGHADVVVDAVEMQGGSGNALGDRRGAEEEPVIAEPAGIEGVFLVVLVEGVMENQVAVFGGAGQLGDVRGGEGGVVDLHLVDVAIQKEIHRQGGMVGGANEEVAFRIVGQGIGMVFFAGEHAVDIQRQDGLGKGHGHMVPGSLVDAGGGIQARLGAIGHHGADGAVFPHLKIIILVIVDGAIPLVQEHSKIRAEAMDLDPGGDGDFLGFQGGIAGDADVVVDAIEAHGSTGDAGRNRDSAHDEAIVALWAGIPDGFSVGFIKGIMQHQAGGGRKRRCRAKGEPHEGHSERTEFHIHLKPLSLTQIMVLWQGGGKNGIDNIVLKKRAHWSAASEGRGRGDWRGWRRRRGKWCRGRRIRRRSGRRVRAAGGDGRARGRCQGRRGRRRGPCAG